MSSVDYVLWFWQTFQSLAECSINDDNSENRLHDDTDKFKMENKTQKFGVADGPIMARYRFIKKASWEVLSVSGKVSPLKPLYWTCNILDVYKEISLETWRAA